QLAHNSEHGIDPTPLRKRVADILDDLYREVVEDGEPAGGSGRSQSRGRSPLAGGRSGGGAGGHAAAGRHAAELATLPRSEVSALIAQLSDQMHEAARELQFELAARLRDEISELRKELRGMQAAGV
ncbi:MAG: UvrB/UvrC motif-containing protein, partial [Mycobacteriales bacterium]